MNTDSPGYTPKGNNKSGWSEATASYAGDDSTLTILGKPVMESWEEPYMEKLASIAASNGGRVLDQKDWEFPLLSSRNARSKNM